MSAPVSYQFLSTTFNSKSRSIESYSMIALWIVCQHSSPLIYASRVSFRHTALVVDLHFHLYDLLFDPFFRIEEWAASVKDFFVTLLEIRVLLGWDSCHKWTCNHMMIVGDKFNLMLHKEKVHWSAVLDQFVLVLSDLELISCTGCDCLRRESNVTDISFQTCFPVVKDPIDCPIESFAFIHQSFPGDYSISFTKFWWMSWYFRHLDDTSHDVLEIFCKKWICLHFRSSVVMTAYSSVIIEAISEMTRVHESMNRSGKIITWSYDV